MQDLPPDFGPPRRPGLPTLIAQQLQRNLQLPQTQQQPPPSTPMNMQLSDEILSHPERLPPSVLSLLLSTMASDQETNDMTASVADVDVSALAAALLPSPSTATTQLEQQQQALQNPPSSIHRGLQQQQQQHQQTPSPISHDPPEQSFRGHPRAQHPFLPPECAGATSGQAAEMYLAAAARRSLRVPCNILTDRASLHLRATVEDMADRIVLVGSQARANLLVSLIDEDVEPVRAVVGNRKTAVLKGRFRGTEISVIAYGMGGCAADVATREFAMLARRPRVLIRLGTCSAIKDSVKPGDVMLASKGSVCIRTNYMSDYGIGDALQKQTPFTITRRVMGSSELHKDLQRHLVKMGLVTHSGLNGSSEGFYTCQGRQDPCFKDGNYRLLEHLQQGVPATDYEPIDFLDMETFHIFHTACTHVPPIAAAACNIVLEHTVDRSVPALSAIGLAQAEKAAGLAVLTTLVEFQLDGL